MSDTNLAETWKIVKAASPYFLQYLLAPSLRFNPSTIFCLFSVSVMKVNAYLLLF
jgi:hypothetical protein